MPGRPPTNSSCLLDGLLRLDGIALADIDAVALASVVPALTGAVESIAQRHDLSLLTASAGTVPLAVRVDRPGDVGADRLVNALAAARLHGTPAIVVDLGTATTFDCVATDGAYVGGAIAPGLNARPRRARGTDRETAADRAARPGPGDRPGHRDGHAVGHGPRLITPSSPASWPGSAASSPTRTVSAPADVRAILTGGLSAAPWAAALTDIDAIDPDLTLKGLAILHAEVGGGEPLELGLA